MATGGKYLDLIDSIVAQANPSSLDELLDQVTVNNLDHLNRIVGCDPCGQRVRGMLLMQHLFGLGSRWIDLANLGKTRNLSQKITLYKMITSKNG